MFRTYETLWRNTQRSGWCTSLFNIRSSSDLQREALYSAQSALSVFKALTLISLCALPTFRSTLNAYDHHYSPQRHLSRCNKFGFFISIITFPPCRRFALQRLQLSSFLLSCFVPTDLCVLPCWMRFVRQTRQREERSATVVWFGVYCGF